MVSRTRVGRVSSVRVTLTVMVSRVSMVSVSKIS